MFLLFYSLYVAMFRGNWLMFGYSEMANQLNAPFNALGKLLTSIFTETTTYDTLGTDLFPAGTWSFVYVVSFVLALITSVGIVVFAAKGIKRIFTIFFQGVR